jgi:hypothetical protein
MLSKSGKELSSLLTGLFPWTSADVPSPERVEAS